MNSPKLSESASSTASWDSIIDPNEIEFGDILGEGSFGRVYKAAYRGVTVAVKVLKVERMDPESILQFKREVEILKNLHNPHCVQFFGACLDEETLMYLTEYIERGPLDVLLVTKRSQELSLFVRMTMAKDIAIGMNWLHKNHPMILHRDLKTANILVGVNYDIKICDFGLSAIKKVRQSSSEGSPVGTPLWMAPEVLEESKYSIKSDVYAFGLILWQLYTREPLYPQLATKEDVYEHVVVQQKRPPIPDDMPALLATTIKKCVSPAPPHRPSFSPLLSTMLELQLLGLFPDSPGAREFIKYDILKNPVEEEEELAEEEQNSARTNSNNKKTPTKDPSCFLDQSPHVPWDLFWNAFEETQPRTEITPGNAECLRRLLVSADSSNKQKEWKVNLEDFAWIVRQFGPWESAQVMYENGRSLLKNMRTICNHKGFFGHISTEESTNLLGALPIGTYLYRFSTTHPQTYALTIVKPKGLTHTRFAFDGTTFVYNNKVFSSLDHFLSAVGCVNPREGSPYWSDYQEETEKKSDYDDNLLED